MLEGEGSNVWSLVFVQLFYVYITVLTDIISRRRVMIICL